MYKRLHPFDLSHHKQAAPPVDLLGINVCQPVNTGRMIAEIATPEKAGAIVLAAMAEAETCWASSGVTLGDSGWLSPWEWACRNNAHIHVCPSSADHMVTVLMMAPQTEQAKSADIPSSLFALASAMTLTEEAQGQGASGGGDAVDRNGIMAVIRASAVRAVSEKAHKAMRSVGVYGPACSAHTVGQSPSISAIPP